MKGGGKEGNKSENLLEAREERGEGKGERERTSNRARIRKKGIHFFSRDPDTVE